jgi:large subunit ribosomal protein L17e
VHYKHCREIGNAIKGKKLGDAQSYLTNVLEFKAAIPITKYTGGIGRHAMGKIYKAPGDKVGWPLKATRTFVDLLQNVSSNAAGKGLKLDDVVITHVNVNQAPKMRRRTYRAHGRINAYMSSPAHIELMVEENPQEIVREADPEPRLSKKQAARARVAVGGGAGK